jgi:hypothetical protein
LGKKKEGRNSEREGRRRKLEEQIVLGNFYRGTVVAGNFGLGGQETARIPGAREPERLFLVGWEVNIQFGQFGQEQEQKPGAKSTNLQVEVCILLVDLLLLCFVVIMLLIYYVVIYQFIPGIKKIMKENHETKLQLFQ